MTGPGRSPGEPVLVAGAAELSGHAFLRGMPGAYVAVLAGACQGTAVRAGQRFFEEGGTADRFWLIVSGHVALDVSAPGRSRLIVETLGRGDLLGLSWLVPPYEWQFGATAVQDTMAFELNAPAVRAACDGDPGLGYELLRRVMPAASSRLQAARIRMLDLYAAAGESGDRG
jgi:CRP/FNR family transcriptional regulator, cyclic AMP receptor protein